MRRKRKVVWSRAAASDLEAILDYVAIDAPGNTGRLLARFQRAATKLEIMPDRGRTVPELRDFGITMYREILLSPWRIIYRTDDNAVSVLAVVDSRRNVEDVLLQRLTRPER